MESERSRLRRFLKRSRPGGGETTPATVIPKTTAPEKRQPLDVALFRITLTPAALVPHESWRCRVNGTRSSGILFGDFASPS